MQNREKWEDGHCLQLPGSGSFDFLTFRTGKCTVCSSALSEPSFALGEVMVGMFHETLHQGVPWVPRVSKPIPVAEPVTSSVAWKASGGA